MRDYSASRDGRFDRPDHGWSPEAVGPRTKAWWRAAARQARPTAVVPLGSNKPVLQRFVEAHVAADTYVVGYDALPGEIEVASMLAARDAAGRPVGMVRVPERTKRLTVHPFGSQRERHRFGFWQPVAEAPEVPDHQIGAVLVPALAFDRFGNRLGFGAGYFDRLLGRLPLGIPLIGLASLAPVEALPSEAHDIAMTHLLVEGAVVPVQPSSASPADR